MVQRLEREPLTEHGSRPDSISVLARETVYACEHQTLKGVRQGWRLLVTPRSDSAAASRAQQQFV